ncbi:hypothetical protein DEO72_LG10g1795 [Vigna unguiculata]|uniref:Uncharacterized protein n=1 Tax=Vigna unguiculata TaxID=3917 RepID=A0A4D6NEF3_VIGUN|nr:hypothetical protein DEO72_LG10g1795 [Vigna unguiculata]
MTCCQTYRPQPIEHVRETMLRIIHHNARPIRTGHNQHTHTGNTRQPELNSRVPRVHPPSRAQLEKCHVLNRYLELNSRAMFRAQVEEPNNPTFEPLPDCLAGDTYRQAPSSPTHLSDVYKRQEVGNPSRPIRTGHNQHTHTGNTRQPELNSRVPRVHPPSRAQLEKCHVLNPYLELNSRDMFRAQVKEPNNPTFEPLPDCLAGDTYRQAPSSPTHLSLHISPGRDNPIARHHSLPATPGSVFIA